MTITRELLTQFVEHDGLSLNEVAKRTQKSLSFISRKAKEFGIVSRHLCKAHKKVLPLREIFEAYVGGEALTSLSLKHQTPVITLKRRLKADFRDIVFRSHGESVRPEMLVDSVKLREFAMSGMTCRQIANKISSNKKTIMRAFVDHNKATKHDTLVPVGELRQLYSAGDLDVEQISKMFCCSKRDIIKIARQHSIPEKSVFSNDLSDTYHSSWREQFAKPQALYDWLVSYGFHDISSDSCSVDEPKRKVNKD